MQAIGSHCVTGTPNSRITASLNKRQRAEIHHQLSWKGKKQGLSLAIKRLISHVGTSNTLGVTHGIRSPRRADALSQQRKEDNKSWKTLPHGVCKSYMGIPICRLAGQTPMEDEGPAKEGSIPARFFVEVSGSNYSGIGWNENSRVPDLPRLQQGLPLLGWVGYPPPTYLPFIPRWGKATMITMDITE